jgi:hypothetical protein
MIEVILRSARKLVAEIGLGESQSPQHLPLSTVVRLSFLVMIDVLGLLNMKFNPPIRSFE